MEISSLVNEIFVTFFEKYLVKADGTGKQSLTMDANDSIMYQQVSSFFISKSLNREHGLNLEIE